MLYQDPSFSFDDAELLLFLPDARVQESLPEFLGDLSSDPQRCFSDFEALGHALGESASPILLIVSPVVTEGLLRDLFAVHELRPLPVVLFTERASPGLSDQIIRAGVSAYVVNGLCQQRLGSIVETACARFLKQQELQAELDQLKTRLEERKVIDRAKGLLMSRKNLSESDAYRSIRKLAMDKGQSMAVVSRSIIEVLSIFGE